MKIDKVRSYKLPVNQSKGSLWQSFQLADNRPKAIVQAKLIHSLSSNSLLQLAAAISQAGISYPPTYLNKRHLSATQEENCVFIHANPGFGKNIGNIGATYKESLGSDSHSEPRLISHEFNGSTDNWEGANNAIDSENTQHGGANNRTHFNLYTERKPCSSCDSNDNLKNARYTSQDQINWSYPSGAASALNIARQYIPNAPEAIAANNLSGLKLGNPTVGYFLYNGYNTPKIKYPILP